MKENYKQNAILFYKTSYSLIVILGVFFCELLFGWLLYGDPRNIFLWILVAVFLLVFLLLYRLDVILDHEVLTVSKGIGLISNDIPVELLHSVVTQPNSSMFDWIYDPLSSESLLIKMRDGSTLVIAIPERRQLQELLRMKIDH